MITFAYIFIRHKKKTKLKEAIDAYLNSITAICPKVKDPELAYFEKGYNPILIIS